LSQLTLASPLTPRNDAESGPVRVDRHQRLSAQWVTAGVWLQGDMVDRGLARVHPTPETRAVTPALLEREDRARTNQRGLWRLDVYAVRPPDALDPTVGTFQIVEGPVVSVARVGRTVYLNFGGDWRTDFTVSLDPRVQALLRAQGRDPLAWRGQRVRVRGWIAARNGPMMALTHPECLEGPWAVAHDDGGRDG